MISFMAIILPDQYTFKNMYFKLLDIATCLILVPSTPYPVPCTQYPVPSTQYTVHSTQVALKWLLESRHRVIIWRSPSSDYLKVALEWIFEGRHQVITAMSNVIKTIFAGRCQVISWKSPSSKYVRVALKWLLERHRLNFCRSASSDN